MTSGAEFRTLVNLLLLERPDNYSVLRVLDQGCTLHRTKNRDKQKPQWTWDLLG